MINTRNNPFFTIDNRQRTDATQRHEAREATEPLSSAGVAAD